MRMRWKTLFVQLLVLVITEVAFNCVGVDDLANYSEFILTQKLDLTEAVLSITT